MARRRRKSDFEQTAEALSILPWQVCLALIPITYFAFHWLAQIQPPPIQTVAQMGNAGLVTIYKTVGMLLQYIVPAILSLAALMSWRSKRRRTTLLAEAERRTSSAPLREMSWRDFEQMVGAHFERLGFAVTFTPNGADGGVDAVIRSGSETHLVQCKQWRATQVGVSIVRELFGVMAARGATGGYVVSIGAFTKDARDFAAGRNIELLDANLLLGAKNGQLSENAIATGSVEPTVEPKCPACGAPMVRRIAKQGANKGQAFFGCSTYPRCRGVLPTS